MQAARNMRLVWDPFRGLQDFATWHKTSLALEPIVTSCRLQNNPGALVMELSPTPQTHCKLIEGSQKCPAKTQFRIPNQATRASGTTENHHPPSLRKRAFCNTTLHLEPKNVRRFVPVPAITKFHTTFTKQHLSEVRWIQPALLRQRASGSREANIRSPELRPCRIQGRRKVLQFNKCCKPKCTTEYY